MADQARSAHAWRGRVLRWAFYLAIFAAFGYFLWSIDWASLGHLTINWWWVIAATVIALLFRFLGALVWRVVLGRLGAVDLPPFLVLADVYARAWLARYIPGTIPWIAGKIYLASQHGISKSRLAVSSLVEAAAQVVAVGAFSLALLAIDGRIATVSPVLRVAVLVAAVLLLIAIMPPVFNRLLAWGFRLLKRGTPAPVDWPLVGISVGLYVLAAAVSGLALGLLALAIIDDLGARDLLFLVGAIGFSGVVGMLTPLVPSGLGTRDATQMLLFVVILSTPTAALLVLVGRVWSAATDVLFWGVALGMRGAAGLARPVKPGTTV